MADVLRRYWEEHAQHLRSESGIRAGINDWLKFWKASAVSDLTVQKQEEFHAFLKAKGLKNSSILKVVNMGKAALSRAMRRGEIKSSPYILTVKVGKAPPMGRPMEMEEIKALYEVSPPYLQMFIAWMLGTMARTEAIIDLHSDQIDWTNGLIDLLPKDKEQTKKFKPIVRLLPALAERRFEGFLVVHRSKHIHSIKNAWNAARDAAGLDEKVTSYSLRHSAARHLRRSRCTEWDVKTMLGHSMPGPTSFYTALQPDHPDYLKEPAEALNELLLAVCLRMPVREVFSVRRNGKEIQRDAWCCRGGLNSRPLPYQGSALPLSYGSIGQGIGQRLRALKRASGVARGSLPHGGGWRNLCAGWNKRECSGMSDHPQPGRKASEQERRAAALRENLKRRKAQVKARTAGRPSAPEDSDRPHESAGFDADTSRTEPGTG
jgi:integrase